MRGFRLHAAVIISCIAPGSLPADDMQRLIDELRGVACERITETGPVNEALEIDVQSVSATDQSLLWQETCVLHLLDEQHWRLDSAKRFPEPISFCRDSDLWFVAVSRAGAFRFDRIGFDGEVQQSIEGSVRPRAAALFDSTHVLEGPVAAFVSQQGITFSPLGELENPQSEKGASWDLVPPEASSVLRAHGSLEWRVFSIGPRITRLCYTFGKRPAEGQTAPSGVTITLQYDLQSGWEIPVHVVRTDAGSSTTAVITRLSPAEDDLAYYSPQAFGLERPARPIARWTWLLAAAAVLGVTAFIARRIRLGSG